MWDSVEGKGWGHGAWLGFTIGVNFYADEWEDHPNHWGTTHSSIFCQCFRAVLPPLGVPFAFGIKVYLNLTCHLGPN